MAKEEDSYSSRHFDKILQGLSSQDLKQYKLMTDIYVKIIPFTFKKEQVQIFKEVEDRRASQS